MDEGHRAEQKVMFMKLASVIERIPNFGGVSYEDRIPKSDVMNTKDSDIDIAV